MWSRTRALFLIGLVLTVALVLLSQDNVILKPFPHPPLIEKCSQNRTVKIVLLWTRYFSANFPIFDLNKMSCKFECVTTYDRNLLVVADAVVFHLRDLDMSDLPRLKPQGQLWVLLNQESPVNSGPLEALRAFGPLVDLTMTYRRDSDVWVPYGDLEKILPLSNVNYSTKVGFKGKVKNIAWFVSHCQTDSKRELIVDNLSRYMQVDIYGSCGNLTCPRNSMDECYEMLERKYKFYLSFENSLCTDYVTEKLFNVLKYDIIPIVYGRANYSSFMPRNSYIDVADFENMSSLASFLEDLAKKEQLYKGYFSWKNSYRLRQRNEGCDLCETLHTRPNVQSSGRDLVKWYITDECEYRNEDDF